MKTEVTVRVGSAVGLHARPVSIFTRAVRATGIPVTIAKGNGKAVNAASPLLVMSLGIAFGDEVTLASDGPDAESALATLAELISTELDAKTDSAEPLRGSPESDNQAP